MRMHDTRVRFLFAALLGDVDGVDGCGVVVGIWKLDIVSICGAEYLFEMFGKVVIDRIVGPESEGAAGF